MSANSYDKIKHVRKWKHKVDLLAPLLEQQRFTMREAGITEDCPRRDELLGLCRKFTRIGLLKQVRRKYLYDECKYEYESPSTQSYVWVYEWPDGVRDEFQAYQDDADTLPCGCRTHVPDARDDPEGVVSCKFCGREYDRERFRELVA
jgi:hypothetical protein